MQRSQSKKHKTLCDLCAKNVALPAVIFFLLPAFLLCQTSERSLNSANWEFRKKGDKQWLAATVPGTIHTDLLTNKIIPDPFAGTNEKELQWIENEEWEYRSTFQITKDELKKAHIELQFDGLDTYANVYLNDSLILTADNMFRTWNADVKKLLHKGENIIFIRFQSAVNRGKELASKLPYSLPGDEKVFARKAQYQYGWDFGPRFVTCGIWKNVKLVFWNYATIENVQYVLKSLTDRMALLEFHCDIKSDSPGDYSVAVHKGVIDSQEDYLEHYNTSQTRNLEKNKTTTVYLDYQIKNPKRWWCNGLGDATLYPFAVSLSRGDELLDSKQLNIGLRTIELVQEKDSIGKSFYFKLNGVPVFMKGANVVPPDNFLPRLTNEKYETLVKDAAEANMNMLRVWGGGVYGDAQFYDECDKKGILVWQDMMFACAMYPGDEHFMNNVSEEIKEQIIRLRNHPSLALWCGNNEIDEGWKNWDWQRQYKYSEKDSLAIWNDYVNLFHKTIPRIISENDTRPYLPSSPSIGWGHKESLLQGDSHYWGVWWGMEPFENYKNKVGRFMSEYGFQGLPPAADTSHQKHPRGFQTINEYMQRDYSVPKKFEDYVYVSQLLQADGLKTAIEAHRRAKPQCMGTLFWQLNDCWSGITWSCIDYYGNRKAAYYQAKRSFENVLISISEENNQYTIYIINDDLKNKEGTLALKLFGMNGKLLWSKNKWVTIASGSSSIYFSINKKEFDSFPLNQVALNASLKLSDDAEIGHAVFYFVKPKDFILSKPTITIKPIDENSIEFSADAIARNIVLPTSYGNPNDNFFDLMPGEKKLITFSKPLPRQIILPVFSFYDVYGK